MAQSCQLRMLGEGLKWLEADVRPIMLTIRSMGAVNGSYAERLSENTMVCRTREPAISSINYRTGLMALITHDELSITIPSADFL